MRDKAFRLAAGAAAVTAVLAAGCSDSGVGPATFQVQLSAAPASIPVDGSSVITAQVTNSRGQTPPGISLEWSNSLATLQVRGGVTDANGRATATLFGQGAPGVAAVTATMVGRTERGQVQVRIGLD